MALISTRLIRFSILILSSFGLTQPTHADAPSIVVSIKPIHSLVSGVMQGVGKPELLIPANQSPHAFSLRPSDVRKLQSAKLIVWVGEDFETPLTHILESTSKKSRVIELMNQSGIQHLPIRKGGVWEKSGHNVAELESHQHHRDQDPHIWLSLTNAKRIVNISSDLLVEIDPDHNIEYRTNAQRMLLRLDELDSELHTKLSSIHEVPYMVFHDAYQFFEQRYGLNTVGSIVISPERQPGAKRIHEVHNKLIRLEARCIFSEPQFQPKLLTTLTEGTQVKTGVLDPVGAELPAGPEAYFLLLRNLTDNLLECLGESNEN